MPDSVTLPCVDCGEAVSIPLDDDLAEADVSAALTGRASVRCAECQPPAPVEHGYRVEIAVYRDDEDEPLAKVGSSTTATTLAKAWPEMTQAITDNWHSARNLAALAEAPSDG